MSARSKAKGYRGETEWAEEIRGWRVPLSGSAPGLPLCDVVDLGYVLPRGSKWQVKRCARAKKPTGRSLVQRTLAGIESILEGHDAIAIREDHGRWIVALPAATLLEAIRAAEKRGRDDDEPQETSGIPSVRDDGEGRS